MQVRFSHDVAQFKSAHEILVVITKVTREGLGKPSLYPSLFAHITQTCLCNMLRINGCKNDNFLSKFFNHFLIFAQNIDCGYMLEPPQRGGSNEYPQSMFLAKNKKIMYSPVNPNFTI